MTSTRVTHSGITGAAGVAALLWGVATTASAVELIDSETLTISNRTEVMHFSVTGPGAAASFYDKGNHIFHETDLRYVRPFGGWDSTLELTVRATDSRQFDPDDLSLQRFQWKFAKTKQHLTLGDYFANFSQYSLNKGIKGIGYQRDYGDRENYLRAAYGTFDGQWSYLFQSSASNEPMNRMGGGLRLQRTFDKWRIGANLAHVKDTAGDPNRSAAEDAYEQVLPALDWEYRNGGLLLSGEHAYSDTDVTPFGSTTSNSVTGTAHKIVMRTSSRALSLDGHVERVSPDFVTLGGGATPDRLRTYLKGTSRLGRDWRLFGVYSYYHNDLDHQLATRTRNTSVEFGGKRMHAFDRQRLTLSASLRRKWSEADDGSRHKVSDRLKLSASDRVAKVVDVRAEVEKLLDQDYTSTPMSDANSYLYNLSVSSRHRLKSGWEVQPRMEVGRQEVEQLTGGEDVTDLARFGVMAYKRDGTRIGVDYDYTSADLFTANADSLHNRFNAYYERRVKKLNDSTLRVEYGDMIHHFEDATKDYRERLVKASLRWELGGKARGK